MFNDYNEYYSVFWLQLNLIIAIDTIYQLKIVCNYLDPGKVIYILFVFDGNNLKIPLNSMIMLNMLNIDAIIFVWYVFIVSIVDAIV